MPPAVAAYGGRARPVPRRAASDDVVSLWLRDPLAATWAAPRAGQHLRVHAADGAGPVWRCYAISGVDGA
jgi:ferredoxin-NADP reductase